MKSIDVLYLELLLVFITLIPFSTPMPCCITYYSEILVSLVHNVQKNVYGFIITVKVHKQTLLSFCVCDGYRIVSIKSIYYLCLVGVASLAY